jgi:antitoxin ParD1/3/4
MPSPEEKTFTLSTEEVAQIDSLVKSGAYASANEVISAALQALDERDATTERWIREEVAPVYDAYHADPSRGIPAEEVFNNLRAHHASRTQRSA